MVLEAVGEIVGAGRSSPGRWHSRARAARPSARRRAGRRRSGSYGSPGRTPRPARRAGPPARTSRRAPLVGEVGARERREADRERDGERTSSAIGQRARRLTRRLRREEVESQAPRQEPRGELSLDAVAGRVERRCERAQPAFARRDGDDAAADPALAGQPDVVEPVARRLVQSGGRHHRERVAAGLGVDDTLAA